MEESASDISDEMFKVRRPTPDEIPDLKALLIPLFESGDFGREMSFGDLEIEDYLDWFLPRALVDENCLLYILEFRPRSSVRVYKPRVIGSFYIRLDESVKRPINYESLALFKLRMLNTLKDVQIWPNKQAAEVHRRFERVRQEKAQVQAKAEKSSDTGDLLFYAVQEKYRGVGLGTRMLSWAAEIAKCNNIRRLCFVGGSEEGVFLCQSGFVWGSQNSSGGDGGDSLYVRNIF